MTNSLVAKKKEFWFCSKLDNLFIFKSLDIGLKLKTVKVKPYTGGFVRYSPRRQYLVEGRDRKKNKKKK